VVVARYEGLNVLTLLYYYLLGLMMRSAREETKLL
jgi:hypothetical protein